MTKQHGRETDVRTSLLQQSNFIYRNLLLLIFLGSCSIVATRPKLEMSLSQAALVAAQDANAAQFSPSIYRKAEVLYLKAKTAYKQKFFDKAKKYAKMSLYYSERAEFFALKRRAFENENNEIFE